MRVEKTDLFEKEIKRLDKNIDSLTFKYIFDFSEEILKILDNNGIKNKNKYLAKKLNCSPAYISKLFNGRSNFTVKKLIELSQAVNHKLDIALRPELEIIQYPSTITLSINTGGRLENVESYKRNNQPVVNVPLPIDSLVTDPQAA